jgi:protein phosphatase
VREHNEDALYVSDDVCMVADGMGGHLAGEVASQLVAHRVSEAFGERRLDIGELPALITNLNDAVIEKGAENQTHGMGTTLVGCALIDNGGSPAVVIFHVGDSRCYRLAGGRLVQLTTDHSHVQTLIAHGRITPEEAARHPLRNVITRALGAEASVEADYHVLPDEDCRLLLCSDGLSSEIDHDLMESLLMSSGDPVAVSDALVDAVLAGPAADNVTVVVLDLRFGSDEPTNEVDVSGHDVTSEPVVASVDADITQEIGLGPADDARHRPSDEPDAARWAPPNRPASGTIEPPGPSPT